MKVKFDLRKSKFFIVTNNAQKARHFHENSEIDFILKILKLLQFLLWSKVGGVSTTLLTTICSSRMKTSITFTANHFIGIVFLG